MKTTRCCSQCGSNGHNSRTCRLSSSPSSSSAVNGGGVSGGSVVGGGGVMLFGVRLNEDPMRKSVSMNNLSQYEHTNNMRKGLNASNGVEDPAKVADDVAGGGGYASADDAVPLPSAGARERKRGVPWTEEEHKLFLLGLQKVGKGDWRGISRNFVKTRTPTQVASHAQKYFLRKNNLGRRRRRSSLFDITADLPVPGKPSEEAENHQDDTAQAMVPITALPPAETSGVNGYAVAPFSVTVSPYFVPVQVQNPVASVSAACHGNSYNGTSAVLVQPVPVPVFTVPNASAASSSVTNFNEKVVTEPSPLSWRLSLSSDPSQSSTRYSAYRAASFRNGDGFITVA